MIYLNDQDSRPIYEQIVDQFKRLTLAGVLAPGEQMPSVRTLAVSLSANPNTIQKAFSELERDGFIYPVKGRGNFVADNAALKEKRRQELVEALRLAAKEARELGFDPETLWEESR